MPHGTLAACAQEISQTKKKKSFPGNSTNKFVLVFNRTLRHLKKTRAPYIHEDSFPRKKGRDLTPTRRFRIVLMVKE
jgi:hypothetical protein